MKGLIVAGVLLSSLTYGCASYFGPTLSLPDGGTAYTLECRATDCYQMAGTVCHLHPYTIIQGPDNKPATSFDIDTARRRSYLITCK